MSVDITELLAQASNEKAETEEKAQAPMDFAAVLAASGLVSTKQSQEQSTYIIPVEDKVPLVAIADQFDDPQIRDLFEKTEIAVRPDVQIEFTMKNFDGKYMPIGSGMSQDYLAKYLFFKVTSEEAANQRFAKICFLLQIQQFLIANPEGGLCECSAGHVYLRIIKAKQKPSTSFRPTCRFF